MAAHISHSAQTHNLNIGDAWKNALTSTFTSCHEYFMYRGKLPLNLQENSQTSSITNHALFNIWLSLLRYMVSCMEYMYGMNEWMNEWLIEIDWLIDWLIDIKITPADWKSTWLKTGWYVNHKTYKSSNTTMSTVYVKWLGTWVIYIPLRPTIYEVNHWESQSHWG